MSYAMLFDKPWTKYKPCPRSALRSAQPYPVQLPPPKNPAQAVSAGRATPKPATARTGVRAEVGSK